MSKFTNAIKAGLKAYFETGDTPTEAQFAEWIDAIQNGIEEHEHAAAGGPASGTGDAAQIAAAALLTNLKVVSITFVIDGGGVAITTGQKGHLIIPFACTITQVTMLADQSGSIVVDIWNDTYGNFPPTDGDSITAAAVPTISAAQKSQDSTLSGWTTAISAADILAYNVDSAATITRLTISLKVTKT